MPFSASIIERNFAYVPDRILKLGGASWLRPLGGPALSTPWERIRLGVLCAATPNGASGLNDIVFTLGLCASAANPGAAYSTDNYIGASLIGSEVTGATRTLTYNAGSGNPYFSCSVGRGFRKLNSSTATNTANFSSGLLLPLAGYSGFYQRRAIIIVDIAKTAGGSGAVTFNVYYSTTAATVQAIDMRPDSLFEALDQFATPSVRGGTFTQVLTSTALNYSPLGGDVNTFEIFWSNAAFPLEISALGASIVRPLIYSGVSATGVADETFEEYAISSGSIAQAGFLTGGSGWSDPGSVSYDTLSYNTGTLANSSNLAPQVYTQYVGTTNSPDEPFEQYATGTVIPGVTVNLGSFWTSPLYPVGNPENPYPLASYIDLVGTVVGFPFDTMESYVVNGSTTSTFDGGSFWGSTGTVYSYGSFDYVGTTSPNAYPLFFGSLAGTSYGTPYDTFESYGTGTVISGVTLDAGSYWSGNGTINVYTFP